jgi:hypothetical protein
VELFARQEIRELERLEAPFPAPAADRVLHDHDVPEDVVLVVVGVLFLAVPLDGEELSPPHEIQLLVPHEIVGRYQASELDEQVGRERLIAADAFRLGDEAEQPLRVSCGECRHGAL